MKNTASPHYLVVVDDPAKCGLKDDATRCVISARKYIDAQLPEMMAARRALRVINLCNNYNYLRTGYYCSLLAQARQHRCIPTVSNIVHAKWKRLHRDTIDEIEADAKQMQQIEKAINELAGDIKKVQFFFGRSDIPAFEKLARLLFDTFRLPIMQVTFFEKKGKWRIQAVEPGKLTQQNSALPFFQEALAKYIGSYWTQKTAQPERYWMAILHDSSEATPPSNKKALEKFIQIGRKRRFYVELIDKGRYDALLEYDALFIRTTTNVNHYTYRFAQKAASENIPCLDDKDSILLCCNKIFLHELLKRHKIAAPHTVFVSHAQKNLLPEGMEFPVVLKIPDGSFSTGVFKADSPQEYNDKLQLLFKQSELILVQEFLPSSFDWRIGVLNNKPLFACKYFMAKRHWQIYDHSATRTKSGGFESVAIGIVPAAVLKTALKAASLIGSGLYGVDIKEVNGKPYIIEINDNPSIDAGVEDICEGDRLYEAIFDHFERQINL